MQCQGGTISAVILKSNSCCPSVWEWDTRPFPKKLKSIILHWENVSTCGKHSRQLSIFPGADISANIAQTQQASIGMLNVEVHDSIIRKRPNKSGLLGRVGSRKRLLDKKNLAAQLSFATSHQHHNHIL